MGDIEFKKTRYVSKDEVDEEGKPLSCYLIDKVLGLLPNQSMTDDAVANILEETVLRSECCYRSPRCCMLQAW